MDKSCDCVHPLRALESTTFTIVLKTEPLGEVQASSTGVKGSGVAKVAYYKVQGRSKQSNTNYNPAQGRIQLEIIDHQVPAWKVKGSLLGSYLVCVKN